MSVLYRALMLAGSLWCHQLPERSPHLFSMQVPLCWRCTGILFGTLALFCWLLTKKRLPPLVPCLLFAFLLPLDVFHAVLTHGDGDNTRRFVTGLLWGFCATGAFLRFFRIASLRLTQARSRPESALM